jgi:hypothetical protein
MRRPWYVTAWETITDIAPGCSCCHLPARRRLGAIQAQHSSARQLVARRSSNSATDTPARPSTRRAPAGAFCGLVGIAQGGLRVKPLAPMELHREVCSGQRLRILLRSWTLLIDNAQWTQSVRGVYPADKSIGKRILTGMQCLWTSFQVHRQCIPMGYSASSTLTVAVLVLASHSTSAPRAAATSATGACSRSPTMVRPSVSTSPPGSTRVGPEGLTTSA